MWRTIIELDFEKEDWPFQHSLPEGKDAVKLAPFFSLPLGKRDSLCVMLPLTKDGNPPDCHCRKLDPKEDATTLKALSKKEELLPYQSVGLLGPLTHVLDEDLVMILRERLPKDYADWQMREMERTARIKAAALQKVTASTKLSPANPSRIPTATISNAGSVRSHKSVHSRAAVGATRSVSKLTTAALAEHTKSYPSVKTPLSSDKTPLSAYTPCRSAPPSPGLEEPERSVIP